MVPAIIGGRERGAPAVSCVFTTVSSISGVICLERSEGEVESRSKQRNEVDASENSLREIKKMKGEKFSARESMDLLASGNAFFEDDEGCVYLKTKCVAHSLPPGSEIS